jgi:spoIIIJ-associated protein
MDRMHVVEIQARSAEEATRLALEQLGVTEDKVDVEILARTEPDMYGEGEVLIRATVRGRTAQPARGSRDQRGGRQRDARSQEGRRQRSGTARPGGRQSGPQSGQPRTAPPPAPRQPSAATDEETIALETSTKEVVRELLALMDIPADVMAVDNPSVMELDRDDPPTVFIDINGRDLGMLIGRRGENLSQMQYMVNLIVNRNSDKWVRVILDIEGYRTRREESLIGLAERVARQVARNRRPIALEPMPANERRIVHMTLKKQPGITTSSSGEGDMRRVTVFPQE